MNAALERLEKQIPGCALCSLHETATQKVIRKGSDHPLVLFIGEAPGRNEDATGVPFCGRAGKVLDRMIEYMDLGEDKWAVINTVKCRPPDNRNPKKRELDACRPFLEEQIRLLDPEVIVLLGNTAETAFAGKGEFGWGECRELNGRKIVKLYHPAALIYTKTRESEQNRFIDDNRPLWEL